MFSVNFSNISGFGRWSVASSPSTTSSSREMGSAYGANDDAPRFETPRTVASSERLARLSGGGSLGAAECDCGDDLGLDEVDFNDLSLYDDYCRSGGGRENSNGHSLGSNGRMPEGGPHASPAASECKEEFDEEEYCDDDGLDGMFGDETMRLLAHAESRLGGTPTPPSGGGGGSSPSQFDEVEGCSPISGRESGGSPFGDDRGGGTNDSPSSAVLHEMYRVNQRTASDGDALIGPSPRQHYEEKEEIGGLEEVESSLLRGPIMAARSAVSFASGCDDKVSGDSGYRSVGSEDDARENLGVETPSKARAEQGADVAVGITPSRARSEEQYELCATPSRERAEQEMNVAGLTPSRARAEAVYELPPSGRRHAVVAEATPSKLRREATTSRPPLRPLSMVEAAHGTPADHPGAGHSVQETPSNQRRAFLNSPQDSVSTMGSASPTAALSHGYAAKTPSALQETLLSGAAESASAAGQFGGGLEVRPRLMKNVAPLNAARHMDGKENDEPTVLQTIHRAVENVRLHSQDKAQQLQHPSRENARRLQDLPHLMASPISAPEYPGETPLSINQSSPEAFRPANDEEESRREGGGKRRPRGSFDSMLERGEEQMRLGAASQFNSNHLATNQTRTTSQVVSERGTPTGMEIGGRAFEETPVGGRGRGRRLLNKTEFNHPGAPSPVKKKKPFLKRGSRKEPSSLHRLGGLTTTPGAVRRSQSPGGVATSANTSAGASFATPASNGASAASVTPASAASIQSGAVTDDIESAQRARLAKLEQMQADCLADLERRQARREEAARDRGRRVRIEQQEEREKQTRAKSKQTPSRARVKSAVKKTPGARGGALTPSQARPMTATKPGRGEMTPSQARPTTEVKSKRVDGKSSASKPWNYGQTPSTTASNYGQTPSAVRIATSTKKNYTVARKSLVDRLRGGAGTPCRPASGGGTAVEIRGGDDKDNDGLQGSLEDGDDVGREGRAAKEGDVSDDEECAPLSPGGSHSDVENICRRYQSDSEAEDCAIEDDDYQPEVPARSSRGKTGPKARAMSTPKRRVTTPASASRIAFGRLDRSASATRASSTKRPDRNPSPRSSRRIERDDGKIDEGAFMEELERKKEEQMALIKNMRKRQEAALREAEGERERVSPKFKRFLAILQG